MVALASLFVKWLAGPGGLEDLGALQARQGLHRLQGFQRQRHQVNVARLADLPPLDRPAKRARALNADGPGGEVHVILTCSPDVVRTGIRVCFEGEADDEEAIFRRTNHCGAARGGGRREGGGAAAHGISEATFYNWRAKYGGMTFSEAKRLKELELENARLKRLLAEAELDKAR